MRMGRYRCEVCGWAGDVPASWDAFDDGGVPVCPRGCLESDGETPAGVFLNPLNPDVARMMLKARRANYRDEIAG